MMKKQAAFVLHAKDRIELEGMLRDGNVPQKIVKRAKIVLMTADGAGVMAIMRAVGVSKTTVWRWQDYFVEAGVVGLVKGRSKPPGKEPIADAVKLKIVEKTVKERPANATHWSVRMMAEEMDISHTSVQRIWKAHGLKPHLVRTFKASNDPDFAKKVEDIVGLYLNPPDKALVLAVDEKSQIQALDRTQPGLPLKKGRAGTMTHDYKRHGTTTLFAALDIATGKVIGECLPRHRAKEFLKFLRRIDKETLPYLDLHLILDNYATHKTPAVQRGSSAIRASSYTSLRHPLPGSISLSAYSPRSLASEYAAAYSAASLNSRPPSSNGSITETPTQNLSFGPRPPSPSFSNAAAQTRLSPISQWDANE